MISVRLLREDELPLVYDSWLESYRWSSYGRSVPSKRYYDAQRRVIDGARAASTLSAAYHVTEPDIVLGWSCVNLRSRVIHYVFVKKDFRRAGVARALLSAFREEPMRWSHELRSYVGLKLPGSWSYDPYAMMGI